MNGILLVENFIEGFGLRGKRKMRTGKQAGEDHAPMTMPRSK